MTLFRQDRIDDLERNFTELEPKMRESAEKEAISILHALISENRRAMTALIRPDAENAARSLEQIAKLYKSAPGMQGEAVNRGLTVGSPAPDFSLPDANGNPVTLGAFRGKNVVLVFYPLDWSPACSDQLSLYQSELSEFEKFDAVVIGISVDSLYSHGAWAAVRGITFPLLADFNPRGQVARLYGVNRDSDGFSERALFIIDRAGTIRYSHVSPQLPHIPDIYELFDQLKALS
jgi:peroxiredoxin